MANLCLLSRRFNLTCAPNCFIFDSCVCVFELISLARKRRAQQPLVVSTNIMIKLITILFFIPIIIFGQTSTCFKNPDLTNIKILDKISNTKYNDKTNDYTRTIGLTKEDLFQLDSIQLCCDSLKILSFMISTGDCGADYILTTTSNKFSVTMKNLLIKDCLKIVWIEEIKAISKSGHIYSIKAVRIKLE
jgi:hypothetical protein